MRALATTAPAASDTGDGADDLALREQLVQELRRHKGNVSAVARSMGKQRTQVRRWIKRLQLGGEGHAVPR
jgi:transposase-like protein